MCWAIPGKIISIDGKKGVVKLEGLEKEISLELIDGPAIDDYVLIHAGYAIQKVDKERAEFTIDFFNNEGNVK